MHGDWMPECTALQHSVKTGFRPSSSWCSFFDAFGIHVLSGKTCLARSMTGEEDDLRHFLHFCLSIPKGL